MVFLPTSSQIVKSPVSLHLRSVTQNVWQYSVHHHIVPSIQTVICATQIQSLI